jgi:hypothetical protein
MIKTAVAGVRIRFDLFTLTVDDLSRPELTRAGQACAVATRPARQSL